MQLKRLAEILGERYQVEREIGQGGMATVYLAQDQRHDRQVAIKLFRPELAAVLGAERFLNEIKVTAHLQHPHILALYDSGAVEGLLYYVMPFVEGESLRHRLTRERQLPIADAARIAREVADALDYAHRHGVIHRDIKPENILLHEGRALVADFGIALAVQRAGGARVTETGLSLGTPQYMSPEQAMADREPDGRSDIYSLGCVLYEMLAGEPPHTGPTTQAVIAKIVTDKPRPIAELRQSVPAALATAVHTAIAKLAADRFGTAGELAAALARPETVVVTAGGRAPRFPRSPFRIATLVGIVAIAVAGGWLLRDATKPVAPAFPPSRLAILAPGVGGSGGSSLFGQVAITPDGLSVIYVAIAGASGTNDPPAQRLGGSDLVVQRLDALAPATIPGSTNLFDPEVSPDGRWLLLKGAGTMRPGTYRLPIQGGAAEPILGLEQNVYAAWHPDGSLWFTGTPYRTLERLSVAGRDSAEMRFQDLPFLRLQQIIDRRTAIVVQLPIGNTSGPCLAFDLETGRLTPLIEVPVVAVRYTSGYLVHARPDGQLLAVPFDPTSRRLSGPAVPIGTGVSVTGAGDAQFAVSPNGTVAYIPEDPRSLVFVDRIGSIHPATEVRRNFHAPKYSPDGRRIAVDLTSADGRDVWILDLDQGTLSRATFDKDGHDATWTADGREITYTSFRSGPLGVFRVRPGSGAPADSLLTSTTLSYTGSWLADGSGLVTVANETQPGTKTDIAIVRNGGRGPIVPIVATPFQELYPTVSPDGRWLAFVSDQSGRPEVYVRPLEQDGDLVQVSLAGGDEPVWRPDGRELFYRSTGEGRAELVAAAVETRPTFRVTSRKLLFSVAEFVPASPHASYDVSPDGKTFVMVRRNQAGRLVVIQNLPELVRRESRPSS